MSGQSGEPRGSRSNGQSERRGRVRRWVGSVSLLGVIGVTALGLTVWKSSDIRAADAAAASQPEPIETVTTAVAVERPYHETATAIGTVLAENFKGQWWPLALLFSAISLLSLVSVLLLGGSGRHAGQFNLEGEQA